jgi:hypothetical protein
MKPSLNYIKRAQEALKETAEDIKRISNFLPAEDLERLSKPIVDYEKLKIPTNPTIEKEKNEWKRHCEILNIQEANLKIQSQILKEQEKILREQKTTGKLTKWILVLTVIGIITTALLSFL